MPLDCSSWTQPTTKMALNVFGKRRRGTQTAAFVLPVPSLCLCPCSILLAKSTSIIYQGVSQSHFPILIFFFF